MKKILILTFTMVFSGCVSRNVKPVWIDGDYGRDNTKNISFTVGIGESYEKALLAGLVDLCMLDEVSVASTDDTTDITSGCTFGKIEIQATTTLNTLEQTAAGEHYTVHETFSSTKKMTYSDNNENFIMKHVMEENETGYVAEINEHFSMTSSNCRIADVIEELKTQGVTIEEYYVDDEMYHHIQLKAKVKNIKSK